MTPEVEQLKSEIANLKELITTKLESLEAITEERFNTQAIALKIQAAEYERRLTFLNGEAERLRQMQATYLPREIYETSQAEVVKKVDELRQGRSQGEGKSSGVSVTLWAILVIGGAIVSLVGVIFNLAVK